MNTTRFETIVVRGGRARLELRRGPIDTALLWDGDPCVITWSAGTADGVRSFVRAHHLGHLEQRVELPDTPADARLSELVHPLLGYLVDGAYRIELLSAPEVQDDTDTDATEATSAGWIVEWAGLHELDAGDPVLLGTVAHDLIDPARVAALAAAIGHGRRPPVVVLEAEDDEVGFLVCGHAALAAYQRRGVPPTMIRIVATAPPSLSADDGADLLTRAYAHVGEIVAAHYAAVREDDEATPAAVGDGTLD